MRALRVVGVTVARSLHPGLSWAETVPMPPYSTAQQTLIAKGARATRCTAAASAAKLKKKFAVHGMALVAATRAVQRQRARARACSAENAQQRSDLSQIYGSRQRSQPEKR